MPITKNNAGNLVETPVQDKDQYERTGVIRDDMFAISDNLDKTKQIRFEASNQSVAKSVTIATSGNTEDIILTLPATSGALSMGPASSIDSTIALFDGTSGKLLKQSSLLAVTETPTTASILTISPPTGNTPELVIGTPDALDNSSTSGNVTIRAGFGNIADGQVTLYGNGAVDGVLVPYNLKVGAVLTVGTNLSVLGVANSPAYATTEINAGNSGAALTLNLTVGSLQKVTMTGNCTFTLASPIAGTKYVLKLIQDATGGRTVTWPGTVKWPANTAPTLSAAAKTDIITLLWDGTSYYGSSSLNYT